MRRSMKRRWGACCGHWGRWADDRAAVRDAGMAGERRDGYAPRLRWPCAAGAGDAQARSALWPPVRVPRQARRAVEDPLARWPGDVPAGQAAGARALRVAALRG